MNTPNPEDQADRIRDELFRGNKIEAIKLYRAQTGVGLAEAKQAVESLERQLHASSPEKFAASARKGCAVSAGMLFAVAGILLWLLLRG